VIPELGRIGFRIGFLLVLPSLVLILLLEPGTAEFVITAFTLMVGLVFLGVVTIMVLYGRR
jgi:hypothetical protein